MDLVAPSGNLGGNGDVVTTDREGALGYDPGNYTDGFGGTSAAAPQVAGVAALMLSVNPNLTEPQVRTILQQTATDMGSAGFDNTFGFGRVNALAAVQAALPLITGPDYLCSTSPITLQNPPAGATTVTWTANTSSLFSQSTGTGTTANIGPASVHSRGFGTITFVIETDCGELEVPKTVWVGTPAFTNPTVDGSPYIIGSCHGVCPRFHQAEVNIGGLANNLPPNINWQLSPGGAVSWSWDHFNSRITFEVQPMTPFPFSFSGTATNACGSANFTFCFISGPNCRMSSYTLSPNPAEDEVVVTNIAANEGESGKAVEILIISQSFETVYSKKAEGTEISVPTGNLPNGQYILQISDNNGVYRKHLIIRH